MSATTAHATICHEVVTDLDTFDTAEWRQKVQRLGPADVDEIQLCYPTALNRLKQLIDAVADLFEGKREILDLMCICAIAQEPMLIFGQPGTAKSELVAKFAEGLGVRRFAVAGGAADDKIYFEYLLNQYTEPDELLGPVDINKLKENPPAFRRFGRGMLADAHVVFLDEIFRGNSAILNTLLSLINERRVYEAGQALKSNLLILYGASNRPPVADELLAFYERFPIRVVSHFVAPDADPRLELLRKAWTAETQKLRVGYDPAGSALMKTACLTDLILCNRAVMELWGGANFDKRGDTRGFSHVYAEFVSNLNRDTRQLCRIDDRKYVKLYKLVRAKALYERKEPPTVKDLSLLVHTWSDFESEQSLAHLVESLLAGVQKK